jgi:hypothetical protein
MGDGALRFDRRPFCSAEALPETGDLRVRLDLYRIVADKDVALTEPVEVPVGAFIEDLIRFRWDRRIDQGFNRMPGPLTPGWLFSGSFLRSLEIL